MVPDAPPSYPGPAAAEGPSVSGLAITSFVCGLLGLCSAGLTGIVSIPIGIAALLDIRKRPHERTGRPFAIIGMVLPLVGCLVALPALLLPAIGKASMNARNLKWESQVRQTGMALLIHANENEGVLADDGWQDTLIQQAYISRDLLVHPDGAAPALALNRAVAGTRLDDIASPALTVLVFETVDGGPQVGGPDDLAESTDVRDVVIIFVDAHTERMTTDEARALIWNPTRVGTMPEEP